MKAQGITLLLVAGSLDGRNDLPWSIHSVAPKNSQDLHGWAMQRLDLPFHLVHKAPIVFGTANVFQVHATSSRWLLQGSAASWRKTKVG